MSVNKPKQTIFLHGIYLLTLLHQQVAEDTVKDLNPPNMREVKILKLV